MEMVIGFGKQLQSFSLSTTVLNYEYDMNLKLYESHTAGKM